MDAQYPFASREDIWRVHEEVKDLFATQMEHGERLSKLERRRDEDARIKNLWGPFSPFPHAVSTPGNPEPSFPSPAEPFKGFDQSHHALPNHVHLENEEETKRGASRANSVRFDESSMHGYYSQANRSTSELVPTRTGSGLGSHPLGERSLSHRSDGRQSSSGQSHRTYSLGLDNTARVEGSTVTTATVHPTLTPPPGLFILGPVPAIIRCWLTTKFSNDSLLYAAVCTGSYSSAITSRMVGRLGFGDQVVEEDSLSTIKIPVHLPEASVYQSSSRGGSPTPQVPSLTVRFVVQEADPSDEKSIEIFLGSDVLRAHNADILFSQDKILIVDDDRNRISVPLVRPEDHGAFRGLCTGPRATTSSIPKRLEVADDDKNARELPANEDNASQRASPTPRRFPKSMLSLRTSSDSFDNGHNKPPRSARYADESDDNASDHANSKSVAGDRTFERPSKTDGSTAWGSWRKETPGQGSTTSTATTPKAETSSYLAAASQRPTRTRNMKVLKPTRQMSGSIASAPHSATAMEPPPPSSARTGEFAMHRAVQSNSSNSSVVGNGASGSQTESTRTSADGGSRPNKPRTANPIGGASAFGWLNSKQGGTTSTTTTTE